MERHFDRWLVAFSIVVAVVAGYVVLDMAGRVNVLRGSARRVWIATGALAMGVGIWSMHFVGMLALRLHGAPGHAPVTMTHRAPELAASIVVAILAAAFALSVVSNARLPRSGLLLASVSMGGAIAGMHYLGMMGLHVPSSVHYEPTLVVASVLIAIVASYAALWLAFRLRGEEGGIGRQRRMLAALLIGAAIAGMHYTGMSAARFGAYDPGVVVPYGVVLGSAGLGWTVTLATLVLLGLSITGTTLDRAFRARIAATQRAQVLALDLEITNGQLHDALARAERAQQEAERASRVKSELLATMSHELRTPLNAIQGHVQLLAIGLHGPLNDAQRDALTRVDRAQRHLLGLINDVLNLTRLESGRVEYSLESLLVAEVLSDIAPMVDPLFAAKELTLDVRLPEDDAAPTVPVCADREKLSQILLNLLSNAAKFTPAGGTVTVEVRPIDDRFTETRVADTGPGIPAEQLQRIFEPFVQLNRGMYGGGQQGTGLGLAISRDLARGMGGELSAASAPGAGALFVLTLPRGVGAAAVPRSA